MLLTPGSRASRKRPTLPYSSKIWRAQGGETSKTFYVPQNGYKLSIYLNGRSTKSADTEHIELILNGSTSNLYDWQRLQVKTATVSADSAGSKPAWGNGAFWIDIAGATANNDTPGTVEFVFHDYANPTFRKVGFVLHRQNDSTSPSIAYYGTGHIFWESKVPILSFTISLSQGGGFVAGTGIWYKVE